MGYFTKNPRMKIRLNVLINNLDELSEVKALGKSAKDGVKRVKDIISSPNKRGREANTVYKSRFNPADSRSGW
jgi:ATP-dependent RNA circularization protein (DNA/RNA ligase family)